MRRQGVTLTEVLVAIFVMGIGLLSLLVLFPLGALNMAQAIKDERVASAVDNANALLNLRLGGPKLSADPQIINPTVNQFQTGLNLYVDPSPGSINFRLANIFAVDPSYRRSSYPVFVDPQGVLNGSSRVGFLVNPNTNAVHPGFARAGLSFCMTQAQIARFLSNLDDLTFNENGLSDIASGQVIRDGKYSWAYMFRQSHASWNPVQPVTSQVIMFEKRSVSAAAVPIGAPQGAPAIASGESSFAATFDKPTNTAMIFVGTATPPNIRKGSWILDATILDASGNPPVNTSPQTIHGYFYRVGGVVDNGDGTLSLDLKSTVVESVTAIGQNQFPGVAVIIDNVVEVFP